MLEIILFVLALAADQAIKFWTRSALVVPGARLPFLGNFLEIQYAQNFGDQVSFIRGRSVFMNIVRILQVAVILYLLIAKRKKMAKITRVGLVLFLAGMVGNQMDYFIFNFVTDMFAFPFMNITPVFNLADVFVLIGMVILIIRILFFEGQDITTWISTLMPGHNKKKSEQEASQDVPETSSGDKGKDEKVSMMNDLEDPKSSEDVDKENHE